MSDALSPERIARLRARMADNLEGHRVVNGADARSIEVNRRESMTQGETETILALLDERARLVAVAEALQNGERGPALWDALAAWKAGAK